MAINTKRIHTASLLLLFCIGFQSWSLVASFESPNAFRSRHNGHRLIELSVAPRQPDSSLWSTASDDGDSMRRMLEESWNTSKMGRVPADPEAAAKEAHASILRASGANAAADDDLVESDGMSGIFFVDLLLPAYDISLKQDGVNLYDEVVAVEYCIALANCFKGKTEIVVRDDMTVGTVTKVLQAREESEREEQRKAEEREREEKERERLLEEQEKENFAKITDGDFVFGQEDSDDDDDEDEETDGVGEKLSNDDATSDSDDFRQKLLANWNDPSGTAAKEIAYTAAPSEPESATEDSAVRISRPYRIASLFGNARVIEGPDMPSVVVGAVRANALPADDEDNIVILNARGNDEMVAVRALATKYGTQKKIILVNCQFRPVPKELLGAETVYSVLPLAGKKKGEDTSASGSGGDETPAPKIVVLRRYPKDWEVFVDVGIGYELAESVPVNSQNKRGLPMEFIARAVTRHLEYVARR